MTIDSQYVSDREIDRMSTEEIRLHFMDFTELRLRMYLEKGVIRKSTFNKAWRLFVTGGEKEEKVRKEYKKLLAKCVNWRVKYGQKFKHIPARRY